VDVHDRLGWRWRGVEKKRREIFMTTKKHHDEDEAQGTEQKQETQHSAPLMGQMLHHGIPEADLKRAQAMGLDISGFVQAVTPVLVNAFLSYLSSHGYGGEEHQQGRRAR
jgi:hypothetical protein